MQHTQPFSASTAPVADRAEGDRLVGPDPVPAVLRGLVRRPDGVALDEPTRAIGGPEPIVRRARPAGRDFGDRCLLGDEFLRTAFARHEARPEHVRVRPLAQTPAAGFGAPALCTVLDGPEVVHRAKVEPPEGAVRLTFTVGGRNPAEATVAGKVPPAHESGTLDAVRRWVGGVSLERPTPRALCTTGELHHELRDRRARGYALDEQENEPGVNCLAPVYGTPPTALSGAVSVSAPADRTRPVEGTLLKEPLR
ncbi:MULTISPECIES: IclR family transcriptional regulator C-terminal domain-containing protein [Streptomyces]|uniref:Regulatory protein n=1 Tax=Streptomyces sviceus (strain ATCC 29083 / DSM 924 / JCM 4929 / NBRC 13980 / NCIMB 11184 / NRRL 5439 / UC 5370) TaxID=463191 RepID=B5HWL2_STRX2|nr:MULTISPECIES: IclR family transcriptional regulator C-terminal domain-containing protein [Streptomyces]EDY57217.1 regulatory protein [Streptomyces sviceus ATCC 29083]MYT09947.1 IclR family transcriptional regulator [Streptomyces sp. SID5470]